MVHLHPVLARVSWPGQCCHPCTALTCFLPSNTIISVFFRLDEVLENIVSSTSSHSDGSMSGLDELDVWLDAVPASTDQGPVLLVGTHADEISNQVRAQSSAATHPVLSLCCCRTTGSESQTPLRTDCRTESIRCGLARSASSSQITDSFFSPLTTAPVKLTRACKLTRLSFRSCAKPALAPRPRRRTACSSCKIAWHS